MGLLVFFFAGFLIGDLVGVLVGVLIGVLIGVVVVGEAAYDGSGAASTSGSVPRKRQEKSPCIAVPE